MFHGVIILSARTVLAEQGSFSGIFFHAAIQGSVLHSVKGRSFSRQGVGFERCDSRKSGRAPSHAFAR